jgi:predicted amidohydrolase YtcJ
MAETDQPALDRPNRRPGRGVALQHRMAYQGEYFVERYGATAASATPPFKRILDAGVKVSAGHGPPPGSPLTTPGCVPLSC